MNINTSNVVKMNINTYKGAFLWYNPRLDTQSDTRIIVHQRKRKITLGKDCWVSLILHDLNDLGLICLVKTCCWTEESTIWL